MPKVFISYSAKDEELAQWLYRSCKNFEIDTFLASISLTPGETWKEEILQNLRDAKWFFFLATPNSISSQAVLHEIGGALTMNKCIVPILYDVDFSELPNWIADKQGVSISKDSDKSQIRDLLTSVSGRIKADNVNGWLLLGGIITTLALFSK